MTECGPAYPFQPNAGGVWPMVEDDDLTADDVETAVQVEVGELPFEKSVGSRFARVLFSNYDDSMEPAARKYADDAIRTMVGKVVVKGARAVTSNETTTVTIEYARVGNDTPGTLTFPMGVTR